MQELHFKYKEMKVHPVADEKTIREHHRSSDLQEERSPRGIQGRRTLRQSQKLAELMNTAEEPDWSQTVDSHTPSSAPSASLADRTTGFSKQSMRKNRFTTMVSRFQRRPSDDLCHGHGRKAVHPAQTMFMRFSTKVSLPTTVEQRFDSLISSRTVQTLSIILTIYALMGDDLRLLCTNKPSDVWFNVIAILCMMFFSTEIVIGSVVKPDYPWSFFFWLDIVATASILFDLTWVSDALAGGDEDLQAGSSTSRNGRTAKMGATVGRVIRVLRVMRILKLYKAYFEKAAGRSPYRPSQAGSQPGEDTRLGTHGDGWDEVNLDALKAAREDGAFQESRVGKRLVALTTRRVILMMLIMLLVLPSLEANVGDTVPTSAFWGADSVWEAFAELRLNASRRDLYEDKLLQYIHYHNWFMPGRVHCSSTCPNDYWSHVFWIGLAGRDRASLVDIAELAVVRPEALRRFSEVAAVNTKFDLGLQYVPREVSQQLTTPWSTLCRFGDMDHLGISFLTTEVEGVDHVVRCPTDLRVVERQRFHPQLLSRQQFRNWHWVFFFDQRPWVQEQALFRLLATAVICFILCVSTLLFSKDANELVLKPVERMMERVLIIADDPLIAMKMADTEFEFEELVKYTKRKRRAGGPSWLQKLKGQWTWLGIALSLVQSRKQPPLETVVLEKTIIKLGSLLALGFGEAGATIVSHNMQGLDSSGVNAMLPGSRVDCIIGNARIRDFLVATNVLQGKVMTFVNQIAEIVHGIVDEYNGAANKNMGETFLLIWCLEGLQGDGRVRMVDMSVISFAHILGAVHRSRVLASYRSHPGLQQHLRKDFRVDLSFGLHCGWAIEGAIGSEFKIDASYLSPNVRVAESLEHESRVYSVSVLLSDAVIWQCSWNLAQKCRLIDKVILKGSVEPLELFTLDLDTSKLEVTEKPNDIAWNMRERFRARQLLETEKRGKWLPNFDVVERLFNSNQVISSMRASFTEEFMEVFKMGYRNYMEGEWQTARHFLGRTQAMLGFKDGPSGELLRFMGAEHNFQAPMNWTGVHQLKYQTPKGGA